MDMKKVFVVLFLLSSGFTLKAQYHLSYFSNDTISLMMEDADFRFRQNKYDESSAIYRKLSKIDSLKSMSIFKIGVNAYYAEKYDSSFIYLKDAMKFGYDSLTVYEKMVYIYDNRLDKPQKAFDLLTEMIGHWPYNGELYRKRSSYHLELRRDIEAFKQDLRKAIELGDKTAEEDLRIFEEGVRAIEQSRTENK
jgi:tetratricopeptide (TPR) repeat protein